MINQNTSKPKSFRDKSSYISEDGKRVWIYAKQPKGRLYNFRMLSGYFLITLFFTGPLIRIQGHPLFLFNVLERKFVIFSKIFWPQDFYVLFIAMISFIIFIVLFTVIYGRIWCGWACPQSVFMELIFRKIEFLIEGNPSSQKKLDSSGFSISKFFRKSLKHFVFWLFAFFIGNTILSYMIGIENVKVIYNDSLANSKLNIAGIIIFTSLIYLIFGKLRELTCTVICPYGRLQGVLLDQNSIAVSYDYKRGEPRGKNIAGINGDCIDCQNCVHVCQQGIDIRNGIQLECTNCSACIDACNETMMRINKSTGLIRYTSSNSIEQSSKFKFTPRVIGYTIVLTTLLIFLTVLLLTRTSIETTILRTPGTLFQVQEDGKISNLYNIKIINKTHEIFEVEVKLLNYDGEIIFAGGENLIVNDESYTEGVFFVAIKNQQFTEAEIPITLGVYINQELIEKKELNFRVNNN
jgi:cytochrome c oxidase accessory protein FixG